MLGSTRIKPLIQRGFLIVCCALVGLLVLVASGQDVDEEEWKRRQAIIANLKPFGDLCLVGQDCGVAAVIRTDAPRGTGLSGKGVYDQYCHTCHETGTADAPLVADEAWEPRVAQGFDVLLKHTKEGLGKDMPPMGTCVDCTDDELEAAIRFLISGEEETESEEEESDEES